MEEEVSVLCRTDAMGLTDMASKHPIIRLPVCTHSMVLSLAQAAVGFHGVEAVAGSLAAGEDFVGEGGLDQMDNQTMSHRLSIVEMKAGEQGTIFEILGSIGLTRRLVAMGMRPGVTIEKMTGSPFGGPVIIRIGHMRLAIGYGMAGKVMVEVEKAGAL